jgi:hypothetical protein
MKNRKVIVLSGFSRGGTSIVWNMLQSHPGVCGPLLETGELLYRRLFRGLPRDATRRLLRSAGFRRTILGQGVCRAIDGQFFRWKMKNVGHAEFGLKYDGQAYDAREVQDAVLCLKSTDLDIELTDCFRGMYPDAYFIGLVRNGYSLCNGRVRRGHSAADTGRQYRRVGEAMLEFSRTLDRFLLVRFEDAVADPFAFAERLFRFCDLQPTTLPKLRLKSKRVLAADQTHTTRFGELNHHYWFDRSTISQLLDRQVDALQESALGLQDRQQFATHAGQMLESLGYAMPASELRRMAA